MKTNKIAKANRLIEAAIRMADSNIAIMNRLEEIRFAPGYAENVSNIPDTVAIGNWNTVDRYNHTLKIREPTPNGNIVERLGKAFERIGINLDWSDSASLCDDCGKAVETEPNHWGWKPFWNKARIEKGEFLCLNCAPEDHDDV